jgi:hypothetical protein
MDRRQKIEQAVHGFLAAGGSFRAKDIAAGLTARGTFGAVGRTEVNSILYGELATRVVHDDEFRWSLLGGEARRPASAGAPVVQAGRQDRALALRAIQRLRSGLPPRDLLREITVGFDDQLEVLGNFLSPEASSRWLWVIGNYGDGKSHSLGVSRELALDAGLAVCQLNADSSSAALNYPQRFLPALLSSLEIPGSHHVGLPRIIEAMLHEATSASRLRALTRQHLASGRQLDIDVDIALERVSRLLGTEDGEDNGLPEARAEVIRHLCGHSIAHRPTGAATRKIVYALLAIMADIVKDAGAGGVLFLLDETESIYTKLPSAASRRGAWLVLSALCQGPAFPTFRVMLAITPDAHGWMLADRATLDVEPHCLDEEPAGQWARRFETVPVVRCRALRARERVQLAGRLRSIYERVYGPQELDGVMTRALERVARTDMPLRLSVRYAVDGLDTTRLVPPLAQ